MTADLKAHADRLRELHHADEMLVLPNVWDAASAKIVAEAGFPVVATASAAISAMLGYPDGEGAPWQEMFAAAGGGPGGVGPGHRGPRGGIRHGAA
jgi:2-methylisocitrate lyase-like PEP mutase family enzyme